MVWLSVECIIFNCKKQKLSIIYIYIYDKNVFIQIDVIFKK